MKKATLDDLLARKAQAMQARMVIKDIDVPILDLSLTVEKLPLSRVLNLIDKYGDDNTLSGRYEMYKELIYASVPLLQSKQLHEEYEVSDPLDIVTLIFKQNLTAIGAFGDEICALYGIDTGNKVVDDLKN